MPTFCYFNGKVLPQDQVRFSLSDLGLARGYTVWEYLVTYNGKPFMFHEHFARLKSSARALDIKLPMTEAEALVRVKQIIKKNRLKDASIKMVLTGGHSANGFSRAFNDSTFYIITPPRHHYPAHYYEKGAKLITQDFQRQFAGVKTTSYIMAVKLQKEQRKKGAVEVLYINNGYITECTRSNFFIFKGNTLITPKDNVLAGVTRGIALRLAKSKFKIEERPIKLAELKTATEAFLTSTDREIMPVVKIDNQRIGNGKVGENVRYLIQAFRELIDKQ